MESQKKGKLEHILQEAKKHEKAVKLGFSAAVAIPEVSSVLAFVKYSNVIPSYEYNFAYVQHVAVTLPILYAVGVLATYLDASITMHYFKKAYGLIKNKQNYSPP